MARPHPPGPSRPQNEGTGETAEQTLLGLAAAPPALALAPTQGPVSPAFSCNRATARWQAADHAGTPWQQPPASYVPWHEAWSEDAGGELDEEEGEDDDEEVEEGECCSSAQPPHQEGPAGRGSGDAWSDSAPCQRHPRHNNRGPRRWHRSRAVSGAHALAQLLASKQQVASLLALAQLMRLLLGIATQHGCPELAQRLRVELLREYRAAAAASCLDGAGLSVSIGDVLRRLSPHTLAQLVAAVQSRKQQRLSQAQQQQQQQQQQRGAAPAAEPAAAAAAAAVPAAAATAIQQHQQQQLLLLGAASLNVGRLLECTLQAAALQAQVAATAAKLRLRRQQAMAQAASATAPPASPVSPAQHACRCSASGASSDGSAASAVDVEGAMQQEFEAARLAAHFQLPRTAG